MFTLHAHHFTEIDSTNLEAHRQLSHAPEGTLWYADFQHQGRGQYQRKWVSAKGQNLLASLLLRPTFLPANQQFYLSKCVSLGLCDFVQTFGLTPQIKWPNDIYVGMNKICGILIEHQIVGNHLVATIVGLGFNVNQLEFEGAPNPTSLRRETGQTYVISELLPPLVSFIQKWYQQLAQDKLSEIDARYTALLRTI